MRIGNYKLLLKLGEGGFGIVYGQAEGTGSTKSGLKIIKPGGYAELIARFVWNGKQSQYWASQYLRSLRCRRRSTDGPTSLMEPSMEHLSHGFAMKTIIRWQRLDLFISVCSAVHMRIRRA
jgi:hypothetical protein